LASWTANFIPWRKLYICSRIYTSICFQLWKGTDETWRFAKQDAFVCQGVLCRFTSTLRCNGHARGFLNRRDRRAPCRVAFALPGRQNREGRMKLNLFVTCVTVSFLCRWFLIVTHDYLLHICLHHSNTTIKRIRTNSEQNK